MWRFCRVSVVRCEFVEDFRALVSDVIPEERKRCELPTFLSLM